VGGAEGVVDVDVRQGGELRCERRVVRRLPGMETQVLEQQDLARSEGAGCGLDLRSHTVPRRLHGPPEQLREPRRDRRHAQLFDDLALGAAEVRGEDDGAPLAEQVLDGRQRGADACVVGHATALERYVEVDPHEHALAGERVVGH